MLKRRWLKLTSIRPGEDSFQASRLRRFFERVCLPIIPPVLLSVFAPFGLGLKRFRFRRNYSGQTKIHLACGTNLIEGWANIDLYANQGVLGWDLTKKLPIEPETISYVFNEHFIEHIPKADAVFMLRECSRVLKKDGILRLSTPDLSILLECYGNQNLRYWEPMGWLPSSACDLVNEGLSLWGHCYVYDRDELRQVLLESGFAEVDFVGWRESKYPNLQKIESRPFFQELIVEARK